MTKSNSSTAPWKGSVWGIGRNLSFTVVAVVESPSRVQLFATPWTAARQASLSLTIPLSLQYCSLQHRSLFSSPDISRTGYHFLFGPPNSFFLELIVTVLQSSLGANWTPSGLGGLIFWCHIFLPFDTVHGVLTARFLEWFAIPSTSGPCFVRILHYYLSVLGGPTQRGSELHWVTQGSDFMVHPPLILNFVFITRMYFLLVYTAYVFLLLLLPELRWILFFILLSFV